MGVVAGPGAACLCGLCVAAVLGCAADTQTRCLRSPGGWVSLLGCAGPADAIIIQDSYPVVQRQKRALENFCRGKSEDREAGAACLSLGYTEVCQGTAFKAFLLESRELFSTVPQRVCEQQAVDQFMLLQAVS